MDSIQQMLLDPTPKLYREEANWLYILANRLYVENMKLKIRLDDSVKELIDKQFELGKAIINASRQRVTLTR